MKKIFAAAALLATVASPAFATTAAHRHHAAANAMAAAPDQMMYGQGYAYNAEGPTSTDPDPFIRRSLLIEGDHAYND